MRHLVDNQSLDFIFDTLVTNYEHYFFLTTT